ncbi:hypothetical protein [Phytohabitans aurantiacus]|uniref:Uncharacterized protein n=1 Tax=Phytohabitans aurantiacus TaxID=3016789 RepID=A0ABQ5R068_9ACTN|nr:hypothetical protein [Phytohabitans aurantiacus]GLH99947.1 hypothetical protein Pa4123_52230 [Phytohabitans aurantiacus]
MSAFEPGLPDARQMIMADSPAAAHEHAARWQSLARRCDAIADDVGSALEITETHLRLKAAAVYGDELRQARHRATAMADIAHHNARVWSDVAQILAEAQRKLTQLDPLDAAGRKALVAQVQNAYLENVTRLFSPDPLPSPDAEPRPRASSAVLPPVVPVPVRPRRVTSGRPAGEPGDYLVRDAKPVDGLPVLAPMAWLAAPKQSPPVKPTPAVEGDRTVVVETTVLVPNWITPPAAQASPPMAAEAAPVHTTLVDQDQFATVLAHAALRHPAVITVRGDELETDKALAAVRRHLGSTSGAQRAVPVWLNLSHVDEQADVWASIRDGLVEARPRRPARPFTFARMRGQRDRGARLGGRDAVIDELTRLDGSGTTVVLLVPDPRWTAPYVADRIIDVLLELREAAPSLGVLLALDPPVLASHLDQVAGRPAGYGRARVRRIDRFGVDVPPPTAADLDPALRALRQDARPGLPAPVWAETVRLADDPWVFDRARTLLLADPQQRRDSDRVLWLWRFYLNVLITGPLSTVDAGRHADVVLTAAQVVLRWHDARLAGTEPKAPHELLPADRPDVAAVLDQLL